MQQLFHGSLTKNDGIIVALKKTRLRFVALKKTGLHFVKLPFHKVEVVTLLSKLSNFLSKFQKRIFSSLFNKNYFLF